MRGLRACSLPRTDLFPEGPPIKSQTKSLTHLSGGFGASLGRLSGQSFKEDFTTTTEVFALSGKKRAKMLFVAGCAWRSM